MVVKPVPRVQITAQRRDLYGNAFVLIIRSLDPSFSTQ